MIFVMWGTSWICTCIYYHRPLYIIGLIMVRIGYIWRNLYNLVICSKTPIFLEPSQTNLDTVKFRMKMRRRIRKWHYEIYCRETCPFFLSPELQVSHHQFINSHLETMKHKPFKWIHLNETFSESKYILTIWALICLCMNMHHSFGG